MQINEAGLKTSLLNGIIYLQKVLSHLIYEFVALKLSIELYLAQLINQVPLMKLGLMNVLHKVGQVGQQLLTTVRQILQRVLNLLKRGN